MDGADAPQPARSGSGVTACSTSTAQGRMNGGANASNNAAAAMEERFADVCKVWAPNQSPSFPFLDQGFSSWCRSVATFPA